MYVFMSHLSSKCPPLAQTKDISTSHRLSCWWHSVDDKLSQFIDITSRTFTAAFLLKFWLVKWVQILTVEGSCMSTTCGDHNVPQTKFQVRKSAFSVAATAMWNNWQTHVRTSEHSRAASTLNCLPCRMVTELYSRYASDVIIIVF